MLIYERKELTNLREYEMADDGKETEKEVDYKTIQKFVPKHIEDLVMADNRNFLEDV